MSCEFGQKCGMAWKTVDAPDPAFAICTAVAASACREAKSAIIVATIITKVFIGAPLCQKTEGAFRGSYFSKGIKGFLTCYTPFYVVDVGRGTFDSFNFVYCGMRMLADGNDAMELKRLDCENSLQLRPRGSVISRGYLRGIPFHAILPNYTPHARY